MKVMPIRYVRDMAACERFYTLLELSVDTRQRNGHWTELTGSGGVLALHLVEDGAEPAVGLSFVATEPLEKVRARLAEAGFESTILDEAFGRSLRVTDPEGVRVQINENDPELYT
jgi:catechol 2,3-dioxygenase-like lactoylglutathione lyase family enzyme